MRDYGKLSPQFWIGRTGRQLRGDPEAQLVAAYLVTAPGSTMIGVFYCPVATIANDVGLSLEGASKGLRRVCEVGFCTFDVETEWVWVHEMARFQIEASLAPKDKRVVGIARDFEKLPESPLKHGFHARYQRAFCVPNWSLESGFGPSLFKGASEPHRCQEQEQEQEQKKDPSQGAGLSERGSGSTDGKRRGRLAVVAGAGRAAGGEGAR